MPDLPGHLSTGEKISLAARTRHKNHSLTLQSKMADRVSTANRMRKKASSSHGSTHVSNNKKTAPRSAHPTTKRKRKTKNKRALTNPNYPIDDTCRFLELAAELRNRIYEYVLLEEKTIVITKSTFRKPALLRTCTQIQNEAGPIYYGQGNKFSFTVKNYNALALKHFCDASHGLWSDSALRWIVNRSRAGLNWSKLVRWLKWCHEGDVPFFRCESECRGHACCDGQAAAQIVSALPRTLDWDTVVLPVLLVHKRTVERGRRTKWKE